MILCTASQQSCAFGSHSRPKPTNMQFTELHNPVPNKTAPALLFGDSMPCCSKLSLHCLVKALIISHDTSLYLQHASCFDMLIYVCIVHLYFMLPTFSDWWHPSTRILLTALELFLLHRNSVFKQLRTNVNDSQISLQYTVKHWGGTCTKRTYKRIFLNIILQVLFIPTVYGANMRNMTLYGHHYMKLHFPHIYIYHTNMNARRL